jgi:tellurium resistance protein TerD
MVVSLTKGGNVSLSRTVPGLNRVRIGLGWDARTTAGANFDLDGTAFLLRENGKVGSDEDFVFYRNLVSKCRSVEHTGDNRTGHGDGDDEALEIHLEKVSDSVKRIVICVTIADAESKSHNFGQVSNAYMRVVNLNDNIEIVRFDLTEDYSTETAMIFGELYRSNDEWKFKAVGQGYAGGLVVMCNQFGVSVGES